MTFKVIPKVDLELEPSNIEDILGYFVKDINVAAPTFYSDSVLTKRIKTAKAVINGVYVEITATETHILTNNATNWLYLQLTRDSNNEINGAQLMHLTGATEPAAPTDSVLLAKITTASSSITATDATVAHNNLNKDSLAVHAFQHSADGGDPINNKELYFAGSILTTGEALNANDAVFISANNTIKKTLGGDTDRKKCVGVMVKSFGNNVILGPSDLLIYGVKDVVYDGIVNAGDNLVMSTSTPGRVVVENSRTPTFTGNALAAHTHTFTGNALAAHTHTFTGNALPVHYHIAWKLQGIQGTTATSGFYSSVKDGNEVPKAVILKNNATSTLITINTSSVGAGTPAGTNSSVGAGTPAGTNSSVGAGTPAGTISAVEHGRVIGKAIEGGSAGQTKKALICLAG